jgi:hypothetical protein
MHPFKDNADREWELSLNVAVVKRLRDLLKFDILANDVAATMDKLASDPVLLVDVIFVCCRDQAKTSGVDDEQFGTAMAGDAIDRATTALLEEFTDFFRDARQRDLARQLLAKSRKVTDLLMTRAQQAVEKVDPQTIAATLLDSATNSPASSASIPDPSRSPNSTR